MPKQSKESYREYKSRVIDPVSDSFCAAKWYNATIWLGSGSTASCHHPPAHKISAEEVKKNPKALHNTEHKKITRKQMQVGQRPPECEYCWKIEDMDRDAVSDRTFKTVIYTDEDIENAKNLPWESDVNLKTLEIAFDRTCNFACSYCNASFSTTWAKDIKTRGPYQNLVSDGARAFQQNGDWAQPYKNDEDNPYIQAFWEWWESDLRHSLQELRITGGEPLMSDQVWKLFDYFKEHGAGDMLFSVNSNLGGKTDLIERLIDRSHYVENFDLYTSCEATNQQAEYIRDGMEYNRYIHNIHNILEHGNIRSSHMMMTINSLSLFSITDFMDWMLEMKTIYGKQHMNWSVNLLRFPSFMSPLALPDYIRKERHDHLRTWFEERQSSLMNEMERDGITRLIDYLDIVKTPHRRTSSLESQWRDFKSFYQQYDLRRGKSFAETFPPILVDWMDSLPDTNLEREQGLVSGDSTKGNDYGKELKETAIKEGWISDPVDENPGQRG